MPALLTVDPRHPTPLYAQLDRAIRGAIVAGRLPPGSQLPTVRQLAVDLRVNANTVAKVYVDLERQGVLETRRGVGTFVSASGAQPSRRGRESDLKALLRRTLDEAASLGFTADDLERHLRQFAHAKETP